MHVEFLILISRKNKRGDLLIVKGFHFLLFFLKDLNPLNNYWFLRFFREDEGYESSTT